jgi:hypothetical protein
MMIEIPKRVAENIEQFTGRAWLLPKLLEWWDKRKDERIFLLTGGPGTGKSMILTWLAGFGPEPLEALAREQFGQVRQGVKAAHFCQAASRNITPQAFAESIANQLTGTVKGFGDAIAATLAERVSVVGTAQAGTAAAGSSLTGVAIGRIDLGALGDELSFDRAFTQPLKKLYASGYSEPMLLLVDALDEADTYTGVKIPDLLSRLADLPAPIRILASTRDEPRVLKFFRDIKPFDLIKNAEPDVDDVQAYAAGRLAKLATVDAEKRKDFARRLAQHAGGVFLYAAMVLDALLERPPAELPDLDTYPLPDGLGGLYHDFLTRELGKDDQRWFDLYEPLLGLIAVAQGDGLTAQQLTEIISKDIRAALRVCKQYLSGELPSGPFRPFHKSFADFLLEEDTNADFRIDGNATHARIADWFFSKHRGKWDECEDEYALRYTPLHFAEAARGPEAERDAMIRSLVELTSDSDYQDRCEAKLRDLPMLHEHMARTVATATLSHSAEMIPWLVRAGRAFVDFRQKFLRGDSVIGLAEQGAVEKAKARLALFPDVEQDWQVVAALIIAWLASDSNRPLATQLRDQMAAASLSVAPLPLLLSRLDGALKGEISHPFEPQPSHGPEVGRQLVLRVSGQSFDRELLASRGINLLAPLTDQTELIEGRGYAASLDAPVLVNIARESGVEGTMLLDEYIDAHAGYNYVQYRNRSLWVVLHAVLRHHPDQAWVRERLKKILGAALTGGGIDFGEMAPLAAAVLSAKARGGDAYRVMDDYDAATNSAIGKLTNRRGANDSWSINKRRLAAKMEIETFALGDKPRAESVWKKIVDLESRKILEGFAGFQAPTELRAADALRACGLGDSATIEARLDRALESAHHIQDYHFCARVTARCNALRRWHRLDLDPAALQRTIEGLAQSSREPEFAADHIIHEPYRFRYKDRPEAEMLPIGPAREADTLERLVEVFQRPEIDFLGVNPAMRSLVPIVAGTLVKIPDPGLAPLLAVHLAARTLGTQSLGTDRARLIRLLVPAALQNATTLDTVLGYLLIASALTDVDILERVVKETGPIVFADEKPPAGQIGPDAAIPA